MKIQLLHFCFKGGNTSEYNLVDCEGKKDTEWIDTIGCVAVQAFPTKPRDDRFLTDMAFANLPGEQFGEGVRIHCVYFRIQRARAFRNVFCFAYRASECSLDILAGVTAEDWYDRCVVLTESDDSIDLPKKTPPSDVPQLFRYNLQPSLCYLYDFPDKTGRVHSGQFRKEQWECIIERDTHGDPPGPTPTPPSNDDQIKLSKLEQVISLMRRFVCSELSPLLGTLRILIVAAIGCSVGYLRGCSVGNTEGHSRGYTKGHFVGYEEGHSGGYTEGHSAGYEEGHSGGYTEGHSVGYKEGHSVGYTEGHSVGNEEEYRRGYTEGHSVGNEEEYRRGYTEGRSAGFADGRKKGYEEGIRSRKKSGGKGRRREELPNHSPHPENNPNHDRQTPPSGDNGTVTGSSQKQQGTSINHAEGEEAPSKYSSDQPHATHSDGDTGNTSRTEPRSDTRNSRNRLRR